MEGEGGPKRSYTRESKITWNKKRALIKQKPKTRKSQGRQNGTKSKVTTETTRQSSNLTARQSTKKKSKFNLNMKILKPKHTKPGQEHGQEHEQEHGQETENSKHKTEYNDQTKSEGKHRD